MARKISVFMLMLTFTSTVFAQSPAKLFLQVLKSCGAGPNDKKIVWLGTANNDGPGSIWTLNGGPVLKVRSDRYFKTQKDLDNALGIPANQHSNPCTPSQAPKWTVGADVPINLSKVGNAEVTASLGQTRSVTATVASVSWVSMPEITMEDAINALPHSDSAFWRIADGRSYALLSAYSVEGLQITYTLDSSLTIGAKASIQATSSVNLGSSTSPLTANVSVTNDGQKVVISIPDAHYVFGEMTPVSLLSSKEAKDPGSKLMLGRRAWITTCRESGTCS